jgi:hypothetical protein
MSVKENLMKDWIDEDAIKRFKLAKVRYSEATSEYMNIRKLAKHPLASDEQIIKHHKAHAKYKEECKEYQQARNEFAHAVRCARADAATISDSDFVSLHDGTNAEDLIAIEIDQNRKKIVLKDDRLKKMAEVAMFMSTLSVTKKEEVLARLDKGETIHEIKASMRASKPATGESSSGKHDPAFGDFEPLSGGPDD